MEEDKIYGLYDALLNSGYTGLPERESFHEQMMDTARAEKLYDALKNSGYSGLPKKEAYINQLYSSVQSNNTQQQSGKPQQQQVATPATPVNNEPTMADKVSGWMGKLYDSPVGTFINNIAAASPEGQMSLMAASEHAKRKGALNYPTESAYNDNGTLKQPWEYSNPSADFVSQNNQKFWQDMDAKVKAEEERRNQPAYTSDDPKVNDAMKYLVRSVGQREDDINAKFNAHIQDVENTVNNAILDAYKQHDAILAKEQEGKWYPGRAAVANRRANEAVDPDIMLEQLKQKINAQVNDPKFLQQLKDEAHANNIDPEKYKQSVLESMLNSYEDMFTANMVQRNMPKSDIEHVLRGLEETVFGNIINSFTRGSNTYRDIANQMYAEQAGEGLNMAKQATTLVGNIPVYVATGWGAGVVTEQVLGNELAGLVATYGASKGTQIFVNVCSKLGVPATKANQLMSSMMSGGANLAAINFTEEAARQAAHNKFDAGELATTTAVGALTGVLLGGAGYKANKIASAQTTALGKALATSAGFAVENEIFTSIGEAEKYISNLIHDGESGYQHQDINLLQDRIEGAMNLSLIKATSHHALSNPKSLFNQFKAAFKPEAEIYKPWMKEELMANENVQHMFNALDRLANGVKGDRYKVNKDGRKVETYPQHDARKNFEEALAKVYDDNTLSIEARETLAKQFQTAMPSIDATPDNIKMDTDPSGKTYVDVMAGDVRVNRHEFSNPEDAELFKNVQQQNILRELKVKEILNSRQAPIAQRANDALMKALANRKAPLNENQLKQLYKNCLDEETKREYDSIVNSMAMLSVSEFCRGTGDEKISTDQDKIIKDAKVAVAKGKATPEQKDIVNRYNAACERVTNEFDGTKTETTTETGTRTDDEIADAHIDQMVNDGKISSTPTPLDPNASAQDPMQEASQQAYAQGKTATAEQKTEAQSNLDFLQNKLAEALGVTPDKVDETLANTEITDEATQKLAQSYQLAKVQKKGMDDAHQEAVHQIYDDVNKDVQSKTHDDGMIHPVIVKGDSETSDREGYIVKGDPETDQTVFVKFDEGEPEQVDKSQLVINDEPIDAESYAAFTADQKAQQLQAQHDAELSGVNLEPGATFKIRNANGEEGDVTIMQANPDGTFTVSDGENLAILSADQIFEMRKSYLNAQAEAKFNAANTPVVEEAPVVEAPETPVVETPEADTAPATEQPVEESKTPVTDKIPYTVKDGKKKYDYESQEPEVTLSSMTEQLNGDEAKAIEFAGAHLSDINKKIDELDKQQKKELQKLNKEVTGDIDDMLAAEKEKQAIARKYESQRKELEAKRDYWNSVCNIPRQKADEKIRLQKEKTAKVETMTKTATPALPDTVEPLGETMTTGDVATTRKNLLDSCPTMADAQNAIIAERNKVTTAQSNATEAARNIRRTLADWAEGKTELTDEQVEKMASHLAGLDALVKEANNRINELDQINSNLERTYKERNDAAFAESATPADQRAAEVAQEIDREIEDYENGEHDYVPELGNEGEAITEGEMPFEQDDMPVEFSIKSKRKKRAAQRRKERKQVETIVQALEEGKEPEEVIAEISTEKSPEEETMEAVTIGGENSGIVKLGDDNSAVTLAKLLGAEGIMVVADEAKLNPENPMEKYLIAQLNQARENLKAEDPEAIFNWNGSKFRFNGKTYLLLNGQRGTDTTDLWVAGHEMGHIVDSLAKPFYELYKQAALNAIAARGGDIIEMLKQKRHDYKGQGRTDDRLLGEIVNDEMGNIFQNKGTDIFIDSIQGKKESANILATAVKTIKKLIPGLKDKDMKTRAEIAEEKLRNALRAATIAKRLSVKVGENTISFNAKHGIGAEFSATTYDATGRELLQEQLKRAIRQNYMTEDEANEIKQKMEMLYEVTTDLMNTTDENGNLVFQAFADIQKMTPKVDKNGNVYLSVVKNNDEYPMNIDFSKSCVKRDAMNAVLDALCADPRFDVTTMTNEDYLNVKEIAKKAGLEIPCYGCFIENSRYRTAEWANDISSKWNELVSAAAGDNVTPFDLTTGVQDHPVVDEKKLLAKAKQMTKKYPGTSGKAKRWFEDMAYAMIKDPSIVHKLTPDMLISPTNYADLMQTQPDILSKIQAYSAQGTPKLVIPDAIYNGDILQMDEKGHGWNFQNAYWIGGVRIQSASDFKPKLFFDYAQAFADLASKKLPAHTYSKVLSYAKLFGLTGIKINMSLFPKSMLPAGLRQEFNSMSESRKKADKRFIDAVRHAGLKWNQKEGRWEDEYAWSTESFPVEEAFALQDDPRYTANVGTLAVGLSDAHVWKLFEDPRIRGIIPVHKSNSNVSEDIRTNVDIRMDYTLHQNECIANEKNQMLEGESYADYYKRIATTEGITKPQYGNKISAADHINNGISWYRCLEKAEDPKEAAKLFVQRCQENGIIPRFPEFVYKEDGSYNENYYKVLQDFTLYDKDGNYAKQGAVKMQFPEEWRTILKESLTNEQKKVSLINSKVSDIVDQVIQAKANNEAVIADDAEFSIYSSKKAEKDDNARNRYGIDNPYLGNMQFLNKDYNPYKEGIREGDMVDVTNETYKANELSPVGRAFMDINDNDQLNFLKSQIRKHVKNLGGNIGNASAGAFKNEEGIMGIADPAGAKRVGTLMAEDLQYYKQALESMKADKSAEEPEYLATIDAEIEKVDKAINWYSEFADGQHNKIGDHDDDGIEFSLTGTSGAFNADIEESGLQASDLARMTHEEMVKKMPRLANQETAIHMLEATGKDWSKLSKAEKLKIKMATGWEKGADGKWRYEMPDGKFTDFAAVRNMRSQYDSVRLGDVWQDDKLFVMYPNLADKKIYKMKRTDGANGSWNGKYFELKPNRSEEEVRKTLIHEIQHYIQDEEGFAPGGNTEMSTPELQQLYDQHNAASKVLGGKLEKKYEHIPMFGDYASPSEIEYYKKMLNDVMNLVGNYQEAMTKYPEMFEGVTKEEVRSWMNVYDGGWSRMRDRARQLYGEGNEVQDLLEFDTNRWRVDENPANLEDLQRIRNYVTSALSDIEKFLKKWNKEWQKHGMEGYKYKGMIGYEAYKRLAGEVESRNTSARADMTEEQRRKSLAESTEDVKRKDQLFYHKGEIRTNKQMNDMDMEFSLSRRDNDTKNYAEETMRMDNDLADKEKEIEAKRKAWANASSPADIRRTEKELADIRKEYQALMDEKERMDNDMEYITNGGMEFSIVSNPKEIERLDKEPYEEVYHAMQLIRNPEDGKLYLYPPMAAVQGGKYVDGIPVEEVNGKLTITNPLWEQADERQDLAFRLTVGKNGIKIPEDAELEERMVSVGKGKNQKTVKKYFYNGKEVRTDKKTGEISWYFALNKGNSGDSGKKLTDLNAVAFDPYQHSGFTPVNDQFTTAYDRSHLVIVKVRVPKTEVTGESKYRADRAKLGVGTHDWTGGKLKTKKRRQVVLSRWDKPVEIVSDEEVAEATKKVLKDNGLTEVPFNIVTPSQREALQKIGVKIGEPTKDTAGKASRKAYEEWLKTQTDPTDPNGGGSKPSPEEDVEFSLGVPYTGSKNKIAKDIVDKLPEGKRFVDLFSGGGAMTHGAMLSGKYDNYHMNDIRPIGQQLFLDGIDGKYANYDKQVSKDDFANIKGTPESLLWSHMSNSRSYQGDRATSRAKRVAELETLKPMRDKISSSETDYRDVEIQPGDVLYADIPYEGTDNSAYAEGGKKFDYDAFAEWASGLDQPVYVSSVKAPKGFTEIWNTEFKNGTNTRTERLFVQDKFADAEKARLAGETDIEWSISKGKKTLTEDELKEVAKYNNRFNEELAKQVAGELPSNHVYELGRPASVLRSTGIPDYPIQLNANRLLSKATQYDHDFDIAEIKDFVNALQEPMAIFKYGDETKSQNIIIDIQSGDKNFIVGLSLTPKVKGKRLEINSIRNVFPKDNAEWLNWITQGKLLYADTKKIKTLIDKQQTNLADVDYLDLNSIAKVLEDFETVKDYKDNSAENIENPERLQTPDSNVEFSLAPRKNSNGNTEFAYKEDEPGTMRVFHGSAADFKKFDHNFFRTGEGSMVYGAGHYVTSVEDTGRMYADIAAGFKAAEGLGYGVNSHDRMEAQSWLSRFDTYEKWLAPKKVDAQYELKKAEEHYNKRINDPKFAKWKDIIENSYAEQVKAINDALATQTEERYQEDVDHYKRVADAYVPRHLYKVDVPADNGRNYIGWEEPSRNDDKKVIANAVYEYVISHDQDEMFADDTSRKLLKQEIEESLRNSRAGGDMYGTVSSYLDSDIEASKLLNELGYVGVKVQTGATKGGDGRGMNYVIFNDNDLDIADNIEFSLAVSKSDPFVSNAAKAVEGIKQGKATPEQWLKMIEKAGGLKKEEDKWMGLSDWLKSQDKKTITKDEVQDFIARNAVKIEEVRYGNTIDIFNSKLIHEDGEWYNESDPDVIITKDGNQYVVYEEGEDVDRSNSFDGAVEILRKTLKYRWGDSFDYDSNGDERQINSTRLGYTTDGLENKKEIALTVPTIDPYNETDEVHFGDAGGGRAVAWIRFGDATDAEGNKVLVIDEIQSMRHQNGREYGYKVSDDERKDVNDKMLSLDRERTEFMTLLYQKYGSKIGDEVLYYDNDEHLSEEDKTHLRELSNKLYNVKQLANKVNDSRTVPDAPFRNNWHELAMKRMLRYAAENGYDKIAWTTGNQQAERYKLGGKVDFMQKGNDYGQNEDTYYISVGGKVGDVEVFEDGIVTGASSMFSQAVGKPFSELVGKELADRLINAIPGKEGRIQGDGLSIGGEGMKGFYDKMIPNFMNKYGKKWGVKVGEAELDLPKESDKKMHSVDVTPEMKESVMQGQVEFSLTGRMRQRNGESEADFEARKAAFVAGIVGSDEDARKRVEAGILDRINNKNIDQVSKRNLHEMLTQVRTADKDNIHNVLVQVDRACCDVDIKTNNKTLDKLIRLKTKKVNGRNMSIAASVDDKTRQIFEGLRGRLVQKTKTEFDEEAGVLNTQKYQIERENRLYERQIAESTDTAEKERLQQLINLNNLKKQGVVEELKQLNEQRMEQLSVNDSRLKEEVGSALERLANHYDESLTGNEMWTEADEIQQVTYHLLKKKSDIDSLDSEIASMVAQQDVIAREIAGRREQLANAPESEKQSIRDIIKQNQEQLGICEEEKNAILHEKIRQQKELIEELQNIIQGGKESLIEKVETENKRKSDLILGTFNVIRNPGKDYKSRTQEQKKKDEEEDHLMRKIFNIGLGSFEYMAQRISRNSLSGDGFFYNYFINSENGVLKAYDNYITGLRESQKMINDKCKEIFGKDFMTVMKDNEKNVDSTGIFKVTGEEVPMSKGQATYLYMVWKMPDGKAKLEKQGFNDLSIAQAVEFIGEGNRQWADWVQEDFLKNRREKYNARYVEMHNTSMANIENYVPLKPFGPDRHNDVNLNEVQREGGINQKAGSLINRVYNLVPVDLTRSAYDIISEHIKDMEEWHAFARVRQDLNYVLSSNAIRQQLNANQHGQFEKLHEAAKIATLTNKETVADADKMVNAITRGLVSANILLRNSTALKQNLSLPAFLGYSQDPKYWAILMKNTFGQYGRHVLTIPATMLSMGWVGDNVMRNASSMDENSKATVAALSDTMRWCIEHFPSFRNRLSKGGAGNVIVDEVLGNDKTAHERFLNMLSRKGMAANALIDAIVCTIGIKSMYEYKIDELKSIVEKQYKKGLLTEEEYKARLASAEREAKLDADIFYNGTQQSNHPAFLAPVQTNRSVASKMLTLYKNSPISYSRKAILSARDLWRTYSNHEMIKQTLITDYMRNYNMTAEEAAKYADKRINSQRRKDVFNIGLFGIFLNYLWYEGGKGLFGLFQGDDEDEDNNDKNLLEQIASYTPNALEQVSSSVLTSVPAVDFIVGVTQGTSTEYMLLNDARNRLAKQFAKDKPFDKELGFALLNLAATTGIAVDLKTIANTMIGVSEAIDDGVIDGDKKMLNLMFFLNTPESNRKQVARELYKDEPFDVYLKNVLLAEKYFEKDAWQLYLPGTQSVTQSKRDKILKEYALAHATDEEKRKASEDKKLKEEIDRYETLEELKKAHDSTDDVAKKQKYAAAIIKMYNSDKSSSETASEAYRRIVDGMIDKEKKVNEYTKVCTGEDIVQDKVLSDIKNACRDYHDEYNATKSQDYYNAHRKEIEMYNNIVRIESNKRKFNNKKVSSFLKTYREQRDSFLQNLD